MTVSRLPFGATKRVSVACATDFDNVARYAAGIDNRVMASHFSWDSPWTSSGQEVLRLICSVQQIGERDVLVDFRWKLATDGDGKEAFLQFRFRDADWIINPGVDADEDRRAHGNL